MFQHLIVVLFGSVLLAAEAQNTELPRKKSVSVYKFNVCMGGGPGIMEQYEKMVRIEGA